MEGGVVATQHTAVETGILARLGLACTGVVIVLHIDKEFVSAFLQVVGNVELTTHEGTLYPAHLLAVEHNQSLPVDAVEVEQYALALHL